MLSHRMLAYVLLISLCLQSCINSPMSPINMKGKHPVSHRQGDVKEKLAQANSHQQVELFDELTTITSNSIKKKSNKELS